MALELKEKPTLKDYQNYVLEMKKERGFNLTDRFYECCLLAEECGELISAVRKNSKTGSIGSGSVVGNVEEELADVINYCIRMASVLDLDIRSIVLEKIDKNAQKYPIEKARGKSTKYKDL